MLIARNGNLLSVTDDFQIVAKLLSAFASRPKVSAVIAKHATNHVPFKCARFRSAYAATRIRQLKPAADRFWYDMLQT